MLAALDPRRPGPRLVRFLALRTHTAVAPGGRHRRDRRGPPAARAQRPATARLDALAAAHRPRPPGFAMLHRLDEARTDRRGGARLGPDREGVARPGFGGAVVDPLRDWGRGATNSSSTKSPRSVRSSASRSCAPRPARCVPTGRSRSVPVVSSRRPAAGRPPTSRRPFSSRSRGSPSRRASTTAPRNWRRRPSCTTRAR